MYVKEAEVKVKGKECAMLVTIGILLYINACLEAERPTEYSPLPVFLKEEASSETKTWADAADTRIVSNREGSCRLRVRVEFKGTNAGDANRHAAFIVNKKSWIDGKDGWLYYRDMLQKDETADPICLKGYLDRQGSQEKVYATLVCDWQPADKKA